MYEAGGSKLQPIQKFNKYIHDLHSMIQPGNHVYDPEIVPIHHVVRSKVS